MGKGIDDGDGLSLGSGLWIRVRNFSEHVVLRKNASHLPPEHGLGWFWVNVHSVANHASNTDVIASLEVLSTRYEIKAGPDVPHNNLSVLLIERQIRLEHDAVLVLRQLLLLLFLLLTSV